MSQTIDQVYSDYNVQGVPASGEKKPSKAEIRALLKMIQNSGGQAVTRNTLSALNGVTPPNENYMGIVLTGSGAGYYYRSGGAWVFGRGFPDSVTVWTQTGGTGAAYQVANSAGIDPSSVALAVFTPTDTNSAGATVNVGGVVRPILSATGAPIAAGELLAGRAAMLVNAADGWRVVSSQSRMTFRGAWDSGSAYDRDDLTENGGSIWIAKRANTGVTPTEGADWTLFLPGVTVADGSVTEPKYATGSVSERALANEAVTETKLAGGAVSRPKLGPDIAADADVLITVGTGGNYSTLNAALAAASRIVHRDYKASGFTVEVRLLTGFVMAEQVFVSGLDLGFVRITSVDANVAVDHTAITSAFSPLDAITPVFGGSSGAVLPHMNVLFVYSSSATAKDGIAVTGGSKVTFQCSSSVSSVPVSGFRNARRGLVVFYGSEATCEVPGVTQGGGGSGAGLSVGADFSGCSNRALQVQHGGKATMLRSNFSNCSGDNAVYVIWNSFADIYQSDITGHSGGGAAVHSRDGSVVCARESDASGGAAAGYHALHAAILDARSTKANNCGTYGYLANGASIIDATAGQADDAGNRGVWASNGSVIEFDTGTAKRSLGTAGVGAVAGSVVNSNNSDVSGAANSGFFIENSSRLSAFNSNANSCQIGFNIISSNAAIQGSTADDCGVGVLSTRASTVNARAVLSRDCTTIAFDCMESSSINAQAANASGAGTVGYRVQRGSNINANASTGSTSVTTNTLSAAGIIFS